MDLQVREKVGKVFSRGNVNLHLTIKENGTRPTYRINRGFLNELVKLAKEIHEESNNSSVFSLDSLLSVKGVIEPAEDEIDDVEIQERNNLITKKKNESKKPNANDYHKPKEIYHHLY